MTHAVEATAAYLYTVVDGRFELALGPGVGAGLLAQVIEGEREARAPALFAGARWTSWPPSSTAPASPSSSGSRPAPAGSA